MDPVVRVVVESVVRVVVESEDAISNHPARVLVYKNNRLIAEVVAKVEPQQGADGKYYPCVTLKSRQE